MTFPIWWWESHKIPWFQTPNQWSSQYCGSALASEKFLSPVPVDPQREPWNMVFHMKNLSLVYLPAEQVIFVDWTFFTLYPNETWPPKTQSMSQNSPFTSRSHLSNNHLCSININVQSVTGINIWLLLYVTQNKLITGEQAPCANLWNLRILPAGSMSGCRTPHGKSIHCSPWPYQIHRAGDFLAPLWKISESVGKKSQYMEKNQNDPNQQPDIFSPHMKVIECFHGIPNGFVISKK